MLVFIVLLVSYPFSFIAPSRMIGNFLLPIYGIGNFFTDPANGSSRSSQDWSNVPEIFGVSVPPVVLSLGLQLIIGIFVWRALVRKTANPFQPLLLRWEAVVLFSILVLSQHALLWDLWTGTYPATANATRDFDHEALLAVVHGGTLLVGIILLACASAQPEHVRVESLRLGFKNLGAVFSRSAVSLAIVLAGIAGAGMTDGDAGHHDGAAGGFARSITAMKKPSVPCRAVVSDRLMPTPGQGPPTASAQTRSIGSGLKVGVAARKRSICPWFSTGSSEQVA